MLCRRLMSISMAASTWPKPSRWCVRSSRGSRPACGAFRMERPGTGVTGPSSRCRSSCSCPGWFWRGRWSCRGAAVARHEHLRSDLANKTSLVDVSRSPRPPGGQPPSVILHESDVAWTADATEQSRSVQERPETDTHPAAAAISAAHSRCHLIRPADRRSPPDLGSDHRLAFLCHPADSTIASDARKDHTPCPHECPHECAKG
jgi:hypothetical protein